MLSSCPTLSSLLRGVSGDLQKIAQAALTLKPNFSYTLQEVQQDVNRVFETGYFSNCQPSAEDTRDGVRVLVEVTANPELRGIVLNGANTLPVSVIQNSFQDQCVSFFTQPSSARLRSRPAFRIAPFLALFAILAAIEKAARRGASEI